ncbi:MAG: HDOD domain-containing protein [Bacteroidetes bacterium]|nr:HDOD domain-containing protein [Bacteroidota bacterium]
MTTQAPEIAAKREKTELVLKNIYNLPSTPAILTDVMNLLNDKSVNTSKVTQVISKDQSLVTKILTIANSPLYGLQRKVTNLDFAILLLGFSELRNIVSTISVMESVKNKTDKFLDQKEFWLHSYLTGTASKRLADDLGYDNPGEAFVSGFLHDLGITVMHRFLHSNYVAIHEKATNGEALFLEAEIEVLGLGHMDIGQFLLEKWNFPVTLCESIANHHNPSNAKNSEFLSAIIHLADYMTQKLQIGAAFWDVGMEFSEESMKVLRFSNEAELNGFIEGYREIFTEQLESARYFS